MFAFFTGLAAGAAHVVTGPDHLAALAPIAAHQPRHATRLGLRWGLGHGTGVVALGTLGLFAKQSIDVEALSAWSEFAVGFVLIAVGLWALRKASQIVIHSHGHNHDGNDAHGHSHFHMHVDHNAHSHPEAHRGHSHAAFLVGALHGAAGTGHLLGVLPSLALPPMDAALYLAAYFLSAVLAMTAFGGLMGRLSRNGQPETLRTVMYCTSTCAVVIGGAWIGMAWPV